MIKIYEYNSFKKFPGKQIGIAEGDFSKHYAFKVINSYLEGINFKSYYFRHWFKEHKNAKTGEVKTYQMVDYGSHTNFMVLEEVPDKEELLDVSTNTD